MPPYPPAAPDPGLSFVVSRVLAGQSFGNTVSVQDLVVVTALTAGGTELVTLKLTPEEALDLGRALGRKAGEIINSEVDDDGKPTTISHRLSRITAGRLADRRVHPAAETCPECGAPVYLAAYPDGRAAACSDPNCVNAHGIIAPALPPVTPAYIDPRTTLKDVGEVIGTRWPKFADDSAARAGRYTGEELAGALERAMLRRHVAPTHEEELTRVAFDPDSSTEVTEPEVPTQKRWKPKMRHNHVTREIRTNGSCEACNHYISKHGIPEEEQ